MHFWIFSIRRIRERICRFLQDTCRIDYINGIDTLPPPLSKEEEAAVFAALEAGDSNARETLIVHNLRLVVYIARKFESSGLGLEDLISIGTIGLIKAVGTFRPAKKIKLATYASRCIENEILMVLRKNAQSRSEISIDEPLSADWDGNELLLSDILGTEEDIVSKGIENEAEREMLRQAVSELGERERGSDFAAAGNAPKRRWQNPSAFPSPISHGWKRKSSENSAASWRHLICLLQNPPCN